MSNFRGFAVYRSLLLVWGLLMCVVAVSQPVTVYDDRLPSSNSEPRTAAAPQVRIAYQFGLAYLPLMVMRQYQLIEQQLELAGAEPVRVVWARYPSDKVMNDALSTGLLDIAAGGVPSLLTHWHSSGGGIKGIAALSQMPLYLLVPESGVRSLVEMTAEQHIALPALQTSTQAILLQMAAAQAFGTDRYRQLDGQTLAMNQRQALALLQRPEGGVDAVFAEPPFQDQALLQGKVRILLNSYDVLGEPSSYTVVWSRDDFRAARPQLFRAVYDALKQATALISDNPREAAEIYLQQGEADGDVAVLETILRKPDIEFGTMPANIMKYARFLQESGAISRIPDDWRDVFFSDVVVDAGL